MRKDDQPMAKQDILEKNDRLSGNFLGSFYAKFDYRWGNFSEMDSFKSVFYKNQIKIQNNKNKDNIISKSFRFVTDIYVLLMLLVYPLIVGPQGYLNITKVKFNFFFGITLSYILLMFGMIIFLKCKDKFKLHIKLKNESKCELKYESKCEPKYELKNETNHELKCELNCEPEYEPKYEPKYQSKHNMKRLHFIQLLVVAFLLFATLSAILSPFGFWNVFGFGKNQGLLNIWLYGSCFLLISRYGRPALWQIYAFSISAAINCGIFLLQYIGLNPFFLYPEGYGYKDGFVEFAGNFAGLIGNVDIFAGFLSIFIALLMGLLLLKSIYGLIIQLIITVSLLVLLQVSSGLLAVLAVNLLLLVLIKFFFTGEKRKINVFIITIALLTATLLTAGFASSLGMFSDSQENFQYDSQINFKGDSASQMEVQLNSEKNSASHAESQLNSEKNSASQTESQINSKGDSAYHAQSQLNSENNSASQTENQLNSNKISSGRTYIWKNTIKTLKESSAKEIAFGTGSNSFQQRTGLNFKRYDANHDKQIVSIVTSSHNLYLDILMNYGFVGLLIYLTLLGNILYLSQPIKLNRIRLIFSKEKENLRMFLFGITQEGVTFDSTEKNFTFAWMLAVISYSVFAFFSISTFIIIPYFIIAAALSISK